jgi:hypothetical protein
MAVFEDLGNEIFGEKTDVFGKEGHEHLEDKFLGDGALNATLDDAAETLGELVRSFARDGFTIVVERRLFAAEESEGSPPGWEIANGDFIFGSVDVGLEVVNPELIEVAEDDVAGTIWDEAGPVVKGLPIMFLKEFATLLHFDEDNRFPNKVGERSAATIVGSFADAEFSLAADLEDTGVSEGLEETVEEDLSLAFLVTDDVFSAPINEG